MPTLRRPAGARRTLESLAAQTAPFDFAIVVVDNDAALNEGAAVAEEFFARTRMVGHVAIEPNQGNCFAINAAFELAQEKIPEAEFFLMIDDDEAADPNWVARIVGTAERFQADVVGGPVLRRFEVDASKGIQRHPLFGSISAPTGPVPIIHGSGNCLIRRKVFEQLESPLFDLRFNFLGGGDMEFFTRCNRADLSFAWCAEAIVHEWVSKERVSVKWLMGRSFRTGSINYTIDRVRAHSIIDRIGLMGKNVISLGLAMWRMIVILTRTGKVLPATHPLLMSIGRIFASLGFSLAPYKAKV